MVEESTVKVEKRMGLAVCKGLHKGSPRDAWRTLCKRSDMCPSCEARKASQRCKGIHKRLEVLDFETEGDYSCGILTVTLPGKDNPVRHGSLREQYDYMTKRVTLPGLKGYHSMRGLNMLLTNLGALGGVHFLEFTWSKKNEWWNLHFHTLFWGATTLDRLKSTEVWDFSDPDLLLGRKKVKGKQCVAFSKLGFGKQYSLDYADRFEQDALIQYSAKVAYATKPFKAPSSKKWEIRDFMQGIGGKEPRMARPFGDAIKSLLSLPD